MRKESMSDQLIVSVSGIRGVVGTSLTPIEAARFADAFGAPLAGRVVAVARDGRTTGDMLADAVKSGLSAVGCEVVDLGIAATPTVGFYVKHIGAGGGIQVSASHNPPEWNGLKLFRPEGFVLSPEAGNRVADAFRSGAGTFVSWDRIRPSRWETDPHAPHLERVLSLVDVAAIRRRKFRVVLDANHGSGATFGPRLLESLGCTVIVLGGVPDGKFEHPPEPIEANLQGLCSAVQREGAVVGFAVDPDADRLALVDDRGRYIGEEYTLALAIQHRLRSAKGDVVINASTSLLSEATAKSAGATVHRTPVGEVHVAEKMIAVGAVIGGEGNGGVIDPRVGFIRDSAVGMAMTLELLANEGTPLSAVVDSMPKFALVKTKFPAAKESLPGVFDQVLRRFPDAKPDRADGLRLAWPDAWLQVRASNTEPIVRVFAESPDAKRAEALCAAVGEMIPK
jgi:phosphomannomutase